MKIGVFDSGLPNFEHDAGSTAVIELCAALRALGHVVEYVYTGENPWGRADDLLSRGIEICKALAYDTESKQAFLAGKNFDIVVISRPGPAGQWLSICQLVKLPVIYFGHDIHYLRLLRGNEFLDDSHKTNKLEIKITQLLEQYIWKNSAFVIYPAKWECEVVNKFCGKNHASAMPIYDLSTACSEFMGRKFKAHTAKIPQLLFVGGAGHQPNHDAMSWFIDSVIEHIKTPIQLNIIGNWPEPIRLQLAKNRKNIVFAGQISKADLYKYYAEVDLVIAPLRYGAGIKRKIVEALAFGCKVLSTPIGFEGIELPEFLYANLCVEADAKIYADKISELLEMDDAILKKFILNYSNILTAYYTRDYQKQTLEKLLVSV